MQEDPKYRIWTRLISWFRRYVRRRIENYKNILLVRRIFPGKADSAILLGVDVQSIHKIERDWSVSLGATLGDGQKIKNYFSSFRDFFSGKVDSAILLSFKCTLNPQNLIKFVGATFEKIYFFFTCELPLILGVRGKLKTRLEILTRRP